MAAAAGLIGPRTVVTTTVNPLQLRDADVIPTTEHDMAVDLVVTPDEVIETGARRRVPAIDWDDLTEEKVAAIPLLRHLRRQQLHH